ncbi:MAG: ATP-binding protein, partial [Bacteroidota bacterium]
KTETQLRENITVLKSKEETIGKINEELHQKIKELSDFKYALDESSVVAITNHKGIITHANDNFCKISGYSHQELMGQDHRMLNPGYHPKQFFIEMWQTISSGNIWRGEVKNRAKDGSFFWMDTVIVPFVDEQRKPYQYLALRADITHRKEADEQLEERSLQLQAANKELESFSYSVSHDLRAPVRAIHGYTQILKADFGNQLDKDATEIMDIIIQNAKKMGQLIDDLLRFSRLSRQELQNNNVSMQSMVADVCKELKGMENERSVEYKIKDIHPVVADRVIIKQVWVNLISNALKYSSLKEESVIEIGSEVTASEIIYHIKDNGAGFDMRYYDKLFGVFQRLHTEEEFDGTGVGLAIVQRIVAKHGGRVWAESTVGEGATFYFTLSKS